MSEENIYKKENKTITIQIDPKQGQKIVVPVNPTFELDEIKIQKYFTDVCFDISLEFYSLTKNQKKEKAKSYKNIFFLDISINTFVKSVFNSEIDSYLKKLNYKKAIFVFEEMFEYSASITTSEISNYNKIIKIHNKLNPKSIIVPKCYMVSNLGEFYKSAFSKINIKEFIEIPRGFNYSKYEGYTLVDLIRKTNRTCKTNIRFDFIDDKLTLLPKNETKTIDIDLYRIVKDPFSSLFIVRTKSKKVILINEDLFELNSYNAANIFKSDQNWNNSIDVSRNADIIILTEDEKVYLFDLSFNEKLIWLLPSNITEGKFKKENVADDPVTLKHLKTLGIDGIPKNDVVKTAYKTMAQIYHPDKNPESIFESGEKMKKLNAAKEYLNAIDFDNYNNNTTLSSRIIMQFTLSGVLDPYESNVVCTSFIDNNNLIYLACKSGNVYVLTTSGKLIYTIDFASNNEYFYSFDSIGVVNQTIIICEGLYIHFFKNNKHFKTIVKTEFNTSTRSKIKYLDNHILLFTNQSIVFYDTNGEIVDILLFNKTIRNIYSDNRKIIVEIPGKFLEFFI